MKSRNGGFSRFYWRQIGGIEGYWLVEFFSAKMSKMSKNRSEIEVKLLKSAKVNFLDLSILILAELAVLPKLRYNI